GASKHDARMVWCAGEGEHMGKAGTKTLIRSQEDVPRLRNIRHGRLPQPIIDTKGWLIQKRLSAVRRFSTVQETRAVPRKGQECSQQHRALRPAIGALTKPQAWHESTLRGDLHAGAGHLRSRAGLLRHRMIIRRHLDQARHLAMGPAELDVDAE